MGWNEPPDKDKGKDPWGNSGNGEGPPDLDEIIKKMQKGLGGMFGNRPNKVGDNNAMFPFVVGIILLLAWLAFDATYLIDQQERGVVLRFGKHVDTIEPGLNFRLPRPIEVVQKLMLDRFDQLHIKH